MEDISITFLGTANAIPTEKRNHSGIFVSFASEGLLFDCGEGIQRQFKIAKISPAKITRIFISHWHGDHILGIPGLLQTMFMSDYQKILHIYGPLGTKRNMELIEQLLNIRTKFQVHEISSGTALSEKNFCVEALPMTHGIHTLAYSLILKEKLRIDKKKMKKLKILGSPLIKNLLEGKNIRIGNRLIRPSQLIYREPAKKITIIMDTSINENAIRLAKNSDVLIAEATFSSEEEKKAKEYQHLTSSDAASIAKKSKSKKLIITHISQRYEHIPQVIEKEAKKIFKNTSIARDFDSLIV